jgi:RecA/RadA recombinase
MGRGAELAWCADALSRRRVVAICGLPGIGKTSLLLTAAHDQARRVAGTVAYHAAADGERIGDVLASLLAGAQTGAAAGSLRAALDQLVVRSQRAPVVLCIDDIHRISDPMLLDVLAHLGASSSSLWIAVASRRQLPLPDTDIDGAVLRVGPLSTESARALWADLEERFGPSIALFDALDAATRASPFALRRAFATGRTGGDDGVGLTGLAPAHAALLAQLCAFDGPVDVDRLTAVIPDDIAALPALLQALLVELTPSRTLTVHDLVRASVVRSARPPGVAEHVVCLRFHDAGGNDLARLRHTIGARQWAAASALIDRIMKPHYGFFPMGAAAETQVLAAFGTLHDARIELPLPLRLARLQLAARHGQGRVVLDALRDEAASEPAAWPHLGTVELLLGDAPAAEAHLRRALADPTVAAGPIVRAFLLAILLEVLRTQGRVDALREVLAEFQAAIAQLGPIGAGVAQVMIAAIAYDQEDYEDAAARLASARPFIAPLSLVPALQAMHALLERAAGAALATPPYGAPPSSAVTRALFEDVDFLRATLLLFAADGDLFEGNVADAEARARDAEALAARGGYRGIQHWAIYVRAECLRMRGRVEDAAELAEQALGDPLTEIHRRQRHLMLSVAALSLAQLGRLDDARRKVGSLDDFVHAPVKAARLSVLPWIEPGEPRSGLGQVELALAQLERSLATGDLEQARRWTAQAAPVRTSRWRYLRARLAVLDAELAVRCADAHAAERALGEAEAACAERGYRREHAVAALIAVALAQLVGDAARAAHWAGAAASRAAGIAADLAAAAARLPGGGAGIPPDDPRADRWLDRLDLRAPRPLRWREPAAVRYLTQQQAGAARFAAGTFGVDARDRTVHAGGVAHSFARRTGLWSVLSALLVEPGQVVSPDQLARHAWGVGYHAVRHHSRLVVSIKRLRDTLGGDAIASLDGGYRLAAEAWAVLEPAPGPDDPTRTRRADAATSPW